MRDDEKYHEQAAASAFHAAQSPASQVMINNSLTLASAASQPTVVNFQPRARPIMLERQ